MNTILEVYRYHRIMPMLQQHQLRVAAVAKMICGTFTKPLDIQSIVIACLLHDMGNVIKFDLARFPEALEPEGLDYWRRVQEEFREKYGDDEHSATYAIAREVGVADFVLSLIEAIGFTKATVQITDPSFEKKICCYADYRVSPFGIVSLEESFADRAARYANHPRKVSSKEFVERAQVAFRELERQIFSLASIIPESITNEGIASTIKEVENISLW